MATEPYVIDLDWGVIRSMDILVDARWTIEKSVQRLRALSIEIEGPIVFSHDATSHVCVKIDDTVDPLVVLHAYDLAKDQTEPCQIDGEIDLSALIATIAEQEGGKEIIEVANAAAEVRATAAQQQYDELVQRLGVVGAPEPQIRNPEEYRRFLAHSIRRLCKPYMQHLEKAMATGLSMQAACYTADGVLANALSNVDMANVLSAVRDAWAQGQDFPPLS